MGNTGERFVQCTTEFHNHDWMPRLQSNIVRELHPTTGEVLKQAQVCRADLYCRHCQQSIFVGEMTAGIDEIITFDMINKARTARNVQESQKR